MSIPLSWLIILGAAGACYWWIRLVMIALNYFRMDGKEPEDFTRVDKGIGSRPTGSTASEHWR